MIELDLRDFRSGALAKAERLAAFAAARWRTDDAFLEGSFRAIAQALADELDRRHRGRSPGWAAIDLPLLADADPVISREGLRTLAYALSRMAGIAETPESGQIFGALAASVANLQAQRAAEAGIADALAFGAPVVERIRP